MSQLDILEAAKRKEIKKQVRGECTFALTFTSAEVEAIFHDWFIRHHSQFIGNMALEVVWENNGGVTMNGHEEIKEN